MGKDWDGDKGGRKQWIAWMTEVMSECLRVLKPGAHGLVWALPRTSHWTATALEDAGFEVRDVVTHLFGSGFPKSLNVGKQTGLKEHEGLGTALKPASEHWILVRKPCSEKTVAANVLKWGTGALNIDASRIGMREARDLNRGATTGKGMGFHGAEPQSVTDGGQGRFPANLVLSGDAPEMLDEQGWPSWSNGVGPSRFFYCAKISKSERNAGLDRYELINVSVGPWDSADLKAQLQVDTEHCPPKVIDASGTLSKSVSEWNTLLFVSAPTARSRESSKSTTRTDRSSTIDSKTLSWLLRLNTSASTLDANCVEVIGGSLARLATQLSASKSSTSAKTDTATSAKRVSSSEPLQIRSAGTVSSTHPTVKPKKLMAYLIRMVTPPNGTVLDPFMGSGSTGIAAKECGFDFIGIEREKEYVVIAEKRIEAVS